MATNWTLFQALCRIVGGQNRDSLPAYLEQHSLSRIIEMAAAHDVLPTLAFRCFEQPRLADQLSDAENRCLHDALLDNTRRNMRIVAQSIKLTKALNEKGIKPLLLKGTAQLLTVNSERMGFRKQLDIDLVVAPDSLQQTGDTLLSQGYRYRPMGGATRVKLNAANDTPTAISISAAHHHLPALVKRDQIAIVELHRHFLPKRFQRGNPMPPLFNTACEHQTHGATFLVPSTEYQIIHIILGKLVHDGFLARRGFPIREAVDYINLLETAQKSFDSHAVTAHCGTAFNIFEQLVAALMGYERANATRQNNSVKRRIGIMQKRLNSPTIAHLLDTFARAQHLANTLFYSPDKLPRYLTR